MLGHVPLTLSHSGVARNITQHHSSIECSNDRIRWLIEARNGLDKLFVDPWFTSLWTLQEAFLCPNAYIVPRNGCLVPQKPLDEETGTSCATLLSLSRMCADITEACKVEIKFVKGLFKFHRSLHGRDDETTEIFFKWSRYLDKLEAAIQTRGFAALSTGNPMALYGISQFRKCSDDWDRIFGIEQIFDIRLGRYTTTHTGDRVRSSIFRLEIQLGMEVVRQHPVLSQMHVFTEPVRPGRGWRINPHSRVPLLDIRTTFWHSLNFTSRCGLSAFIEDGNAYGRFTGKTCAFEHLQLAWAETMPHATKAVTATYSPQQIFLDATLSMQDLELFLPANDKSLGPEWSAVWGRSMDVPRGEQQHSLALWMKLHLTRLLSTSIAECRNLEVLLLGSFADQSEVDGHVTESACTGRRSYGLYHVGLIFVESRITNKYSRRIGFVIWEYGRTHAGIRSTHYRAGHEELLWASEENEIWKSAQGLFG
jgi:hypothetical protein